MQELIRLRFLERDRAFAQTLKTLKNEMSAQGTLYSGQTIKRGHDALARELVESRATILTTILENLKITKPRKIDPELTETAVEWLRNRKESLEGQYLDQMKAVVSRLQNTKMLAPYLSLSDALELSEHELRVELAQELGNYMTSRGATLYDRMKNEFLDRPLIVIGLIAVAAASSIIAFLKLLGILENGS
jgi:hypothetical protein